MVGKKRDQLKENFGWDSQGSLEGFLDNLEANIDLPAESPTASKKPSIGLLLAKACVLTTVVISLLMWFIWPEINNNSIDQGYQVKVEAEAKKKVVTEILLKQKAEADELAQKETSSMTEITLQDVTRINARSAVEKFKLYKVSVHIANVRNAPSSEAKIVIRLKRDAEVTVLKEKGAWYQIRLQKGSLGWIHHRLLK